MMNKLIIGLLATSVAFISCGDDDDGNDNMENGTAVAAVIAGGPFNFDVDEEVDNVDGVTIAQPGVGESSTWVITDTEGTILSIPPTVAALEEVNFDEAGTGTCLIWYLNFNGDVSNVTLGNNADEIEGDFALSNSITVERNEVTNAGTISGGPYAFQVDGIPDFAEDLELDATRASGESGTWVITDDKLEILRLLPTLDDVKMVNFDGAGAGTCLIWYARFNGDLMGAEVGMNAADIQGDIDLSNFITVERTQNVEPGVISGGPYAFTVGDGIADMVSGLEVDSSMATGDNATWVITDTELNILGLPPKLDDVEANDFEVAGPGTCLIWYLRFNDGLQGAELNANAADLEGEFALSNSIEVVRS